MVEIDVAVLNDILNRLEDLEHFKSFHQGTDVGAAGMQYPHPNLKANTIVVANEAIRLDKFGMEIFAKTGAFRAIRFIESDAILSPQATGFEPYSTITGQVTDTLSNIGMVAFQSTTLGATLYVISDTTGGGKDYVEVSPGIVFDSSSPLTVPNNMLYADVNAGGNLKFKHSNGTTYTLAPVGGVGSNTTAAHYDNSTTETNLGAITVAANTFSSGAVFRWVWSGAISMASGTCHIRLKVGSNTIWEITTGDLAIAPADLQGVSIILDFFPGTGTNYNISGFIGLGNSLASATGQSGDFSGGHVTAAYSNFVFNVASSNVLQVSTQFSLAGTDNDAYFFGSYVGKEV